MTLENREEILRIIDSAEVTQVFQNMIDEQTKIIMQAIHSSEDEKQNEELRNITYKLDETVSKNNKLTRELELAKFDKERAVVREQELLHEINRKNQEISSINKITQNLNDELDYTRENCKSTEKLLAKANEEFRLLNQKYEKYKEFDEAYAIYCSLSEETKDRLKNIFGIDNIFVFLTSIRNWENVDGLWNYVKRRVIEQDDAEANTLVSMFVLIFSLHTKQFANGNYKLITAKKGDKFDPEVHSIRGIKTDGYITDSLLPGIYNIEKRMVLYKVIVEVQ